MNNNTTAIRHLSLYKRMATLPAFLLLLAFLAACGSGSGSTTSQDDTGDLTDASSHNKSSAPTELTAQINTAPESVSASEPVVFDASASTGSIKEYLWDFGDGNVGSGVDSSHSFAEAGTYLVTLTVVEENGNAAEMSREIIVNPPPNQPPVADFRVSPASGQAPVLISFIPSGAADPDGEIVRYAWDFGDGKNAIGQIANHTYTGPGNYTATLTVTDNDGATAAASFEVIVSAPPPNQPPAAVFTASPASGEAPLQVTFNGSASSDPDGSITSHRWSFGDGQTGSGATASHSYAGPGNYTATLTVTDNDGATAAASFEVVVSAPPPNQPPVAVFTASPASGEAPLQVTFNGSASSDPDGSITSYRWSFGDGQTGSGAIASHSYSTPGTYEARLTVTDDRSDSASTSRVITVRETVADADCSTNPCDENATCDDSGVEVRCSCNEGWSGDGFSCSMVDACENNTSREGTVPCSGGYYLQLCQNGQWSDTSVCSADDGDGDLVGVVDDPNDADNTVCGDSDGDGCDDCSVSGLFSPANDGWDENGDGACELSLDYDCMNGANAATDPYRLQSCIQFTYINQDRKLFADEAGNGAPLKWNEDIWEVAINHTVDMCENVFFNHTNPAGQNPSDRAQAAGLPYGLAENIAINLDPGAAQYAFMEEPTCVGHRANVLESRAIEAGIGYHLCDNPGNASWYGYEFVTQNFRWDFRISASAYCQDESRVCQVPPNPPTTAPCPADLIAWGFCPEPSEETLQGWGCQ